jgi:hypothetical protein
MQHMSNPFGSNLDDDSAGLPEVRMEPAVVRDAPKRKKVEAVITEPRVRIQLEENVDIPPTGLFLGAQGTGYILKPGIPALVPLSVVNILDTAIMSTPIIDPQTQQVTGFRDRLRFSYRVLGTVPAQAAA